MASFCTNGSYASNFSNDVGLLISHINSVDLPLSKRILNIIHELLVRSDGNDIDIAPLLTSLAYTAPEGIHGFVIKLVYKLEIHCSAKYPDDDQLYIVFTEDLSGLNIADIIEKIKNLFQCSK